MNDRSEYAIRRQAVRIHEETGSFKQALEEVHRSRGWLSKWLQRYRGQGLKGLRDRDRTPKRVWKKTSDRMVQRVISIRDELVAHKTRRSAFSGIGAEAIHWELSQRGVRNIPSIPTIERILVRAGKTRRGKSKRTSNGPPYPYLRAERMGDLHQTALVGPRHLRGPGGVTRFFSFHTVDVAGHTVVASQFVDKRTISLCRHLVASWGFMGVPKASQFDKQQLKVKSFVGTSRNALLSQLWVALVAYLLLSYLKFRSRFAWSLYTLSSILPTNLFSRRNLWDWLNAPFHPRSQSPPLEPQLRLSFG